MRRWLVVLALALSVPARADTPDELVHLEERCAADIWSSCDRIRDLISGEDIAARKRYAAACAKGEAIQCAFVGDWLFEHGVGNENQLGDPLPWFRRACKAGSKYGCQRYAFLLPDARALPIYEDLCARDWVPGCMSAGYVLDRLDWKAYSRRAIDAYAKACTLGDPDGCWQAGFAFASLPGTTAEARALWRNRMDAACAAGNGSSCRLLGHIYECGIGTTCDGPRARAYERGHEHEPEPQRPRPGQIPRDRRVKRCTCAVAP